MALVPTIVEQCLCYAWTCFVGRFTVLVQAYMSDGCELFIPIIIEDMNRISDAFSNCTGIWPVLWRS